MIKIHIIEEGGNSSSRGRWYCLLLLLLLDAPPADAAAAVIVLRVLSFFLSVDQARENEEEEEERLKTKLRQTRREEEESSISWVGNTQIKRGNKLASSHRLSSPMACWCGVCFAFPLFLPSSCSSSSFSSSLLDREIAERNYSTVVFLLLCRFRLSFS